MVQAASAAAAASLAGKTLFITGASRGIGKAIALRAARDGARIVVAAKTAEPDARLPGTIHSAAAEIVAAGGEALPLQVDIRDEAQVQDAVARAAAYFGGIDILVNNASAISLTRAEATPLKRYDLMMDINVRGAFVCTQACLPQLRRAANPHVLLLAPPLDPDPRWFAQHAAYTVSKYAMSLLGRGLAAELRDDGIAVNTLWPRTLIETSALKVPGLDGTGDGRTPQIMADAAYRILTRPSRQFSGHACLDETVLREAGVDDFDPYLARPGTTPALDLFVSA
ncbi:SDR family oxidoreductase [Solimonas variicoloris]|uniref:SDR family oxidoreductase n=1 Tax=Solimonas variicoloris TaxID=254408 RepID=UPI000361D705|nr:NAD(P)-dependent oxidoreductase [Solimonas variicoloris]